MKSLLYEANSTQVNHAEAKELTVSNEEYSFLKIQHLLEILEDSVVRERKGIRMYLVNGIYLVLDRSKLIYKGLCECEAGAKMSAYFYSCENQKLRTYLGT